MDDEYANDDRAPKTDGLAEETWYYLKYWMIRPFIRGMLFGMGHFISLRIIGPYLSDKLQIKYR